MFAASYNKPGDTERFRDYMGFLSKLRTSGKTNMMGAAPYLQAEFNLSKKESKDLLAYWMGSYRNPDLDESLNEASVDKGFQKEWERDSRVLMNHLKYEIKQNPKLKRYFTQLLDYVERASEVPAAMAMKLGIDESKLNEIKVYTKDSKTRDIKMLKFKSLKEYHAYSNKRL